MTHVGDDLNDYEGRHSNGDGGGGGDAESPTSQFCHDGVVVERYPVALSAEMQRRFTTIGAVDHMSAAATSALPATSSSCSPGIPMDAFQDSSSSSLHLDEWDVDHFLDTSEKLKFIQKVDTPSLVLEKESTDFKLLHSLIYELSKNAATFCPYHSSDPRTSPFFAHVFEAFWSRIPYLQQLQEDGVLPGDKATSKYKNLKSLLRWKVQKNFGVLMKKYNLKRKISL